MKRSMSNYCDAPSGKAICNGPFREDISSSNVGNEENLHALDFLCQPSQDLNSLSPAPPIEQVSYRLKAMHYNRNGLHFSYYEHYFPATEADLIFENLKKEIKYLPPEVTAFRFYGKLVPMPRKMAAFGENKITYTFSGKTFTAQPFTPQLLKLKKDGDQYLPGGKNFNYAVVNWYEDGLHSISPHKDNETDLDSSSPIASYSFGCSRKMIFRCKGHKKVELILKHGSVLIMKPPTNDIWTHEIPKDKHVTDPRLNITFRKITK